MKMWKKAGVGFFLVLGIIASINIVHEMVHYIITRHFGSDVREICFIGIDFTENYTFMKRSAGWIVVANETEDSYRWNNYWDWNLR